MSLFTQVVICSGRVVATCYICCNTGKESICIIRSPSVKTLNRVVGRVAGHKPCVTPTVSSILTENTITINVKCEILPTECSTDTIHSEWITVAEFYNIVFVKFTITVLIYIFQSTRV